MGDAGDAETAFVDTAFEGAETFGAVEEDGVCAADVERTVWFAGVGGTVVAGEDDERVRGCAGFVEGGADAADVGIEHADHGGVGGSGAGVGEIAVFALIGLGVPVAREFVDLVGGRVHGDVGFDEGEVEEEWFGGRGGGDEGFGFRDHAERGVGLAVERGSGETVGREFGVTGDVRGVEGDAVVVSPEV